MQAPQPGDSSPHQSEWLPAEAVLQQLASPLKQLNGGGSPRKSGSPLKGGGDGRRLSTGARCSLSAVALPESHPVSPCSERGDASSDGSAGGSGSPQQLGWGGRGGGGIPAYRGAAAAPPAAPAAAAAEERLTLNLFVQEGGGAAEEAARLQADLAAAQQRLRHLEAAVAAAAAAPQRLPAEAVQLVVNVTEPPMPAAALQQQQAAQPVQLVLQIVEQAAPAEEPAAAGEGPAPAALAAQLHRAEACREELARQAGQLRGRVAKVGGWAREGGAAPAEPRCPLPSAAMHAATCSAGAPRCSRVLLALQPLPTHWLLPTAPLRSWRAWCRRGRGGCGRRPQSWSPCERGRAS